MLNTFGVAIGIGLFLWFARIMRRMDEQGELGQSDVVGPDQGRRRSTGGVTIEVVFVTVMIRCRTGSRR